MVTPVKSRFLLFALLLTCITLQGQEVFYTSYHSFSEKEGYQVLEGPQRITQSKEGLLWIGSDNGLFAFDGTHFENYRHLRNDSNSLPSNLVSFNYQDRENRHWVSIPSFGLYRFDPIAKTFSKFRYRNEAEFNIHQYNINLPTQTRSGDLWFPLPYFGVAKWSQSEQKMTPYKFCESSACDDFYHINNVNSIVEDVDDNSLWMATNDGLIHFFPSSGKLNHYKDKPSPTGDVYTYLLFDAGKRLWIGSWGNGLKLFDRATHRFTTYKWNTVSSGTKNICIGIGQAEDQNLWIASMDNGLMIFHPQKEKFLPVSSMEDSPSDLSAISFFQNKNGIIWLASKKKLLRLYPKENKFAFHSVKSVLDKTPGSHLLNTFIKTGSSLLIGVYYDGYLIEYNEQTQKARRLNNHQIRNVRCLSKDKGGNIWIGTRYGLYTSLTKGQNFTGLVNKRSALIAVNALLHNEDGSLWVASDQGLAHYTPAQEKWKWIYGSPDIKALPAVRVNAVYKDKAGNIWFGTTNKGLGCYRDISNEIAFFNKQRNNAYPTDACESIQETPDGRILFTQGSSGLGILTHPFTARENIRVINSSDGLPSDKILNIFRDRNQRYWLFSTNGFCLFDVNQLKVARHFTSRLGLFENVIYSTPYQDESGRIYVGFNDNFQVFNPDSLLAAATVNGSMYVSTIKINGSPLRRSAMQMDKLQLAHNETNLAFQFAFLSSTQTPGFQYAYRLTGIDPGWNYNGIEGSCQYNNLPPGNYLLRIRALNENHTWSSPEYLLSIVVSPPWYKSWWFSFLLALSALLATAAIFRYRVTQIKKQNRLTTQFNKKINEMELRALRAQMNPHFIFNCLNSINRYIVKSDHKTASNYLTKFAKLIRLILDNSASDSITLEREIQTLQLYIDMERLRFDHAFEYEIDTGNITNPETISFPSMLLQPYVENAIWHGLLHKQAGTGKLWIRFYLTSPLLLQVEIEDNGIGRKKAKELSEMEAFKRKSYGMQISKERIELINELYSLRAKVQITDLEKDQQSAGTKVVLQIPLKRE